mmetsp:Transcript_9127/g.22753  ORF Transcript_9127/g.22753 Transcript_9127/m.22753 type:complete len:223 (-) Transcript_9127:1044-1712(-)
MADMSNTPVLKAPSHIGNRFSTSACSNSLATRAERRHGEDEPEAASSSTKMSTACSSSSCPPLSDFATCSRVVAPCGRPRKVAQRAGSGSSLAGRSPKWVVMRPSLAAPLSAAPDRRAATMPAKSRSQASSRSCEATPVRSRAPRKGMLRCLHSRSNAHFSDSSSCSPWTTAAQTTSTLQSASSRSRKLGKECTPRPMRPMRWILRGAGNPGWSMILITPFM